MKVLFTGCAGNIAQRGVYPALVEAGNPWEIVEFDKKTTGGKLEVSEDLVKAAKGCDMIVHLAAIPGQFLTDDMREYFRDNILGTYNVLLAAQQTPTVKRVVVASSVAYYGIDTGDEHHPYIGPYFLPISEEHPTIVLREGKVVWEYDTTKVALEGFTRWPYWKFDRILLRYTNPCDTDQDYLNKLGRGVAQYAPLRPDLVAIDLEACMAIHSGRATVRATLCNLDKYWDAVTGFACVPVNVAVSKPDEPVLAILENKFPGVPIVKHPLNIYDVDRCVELFGNIDSEVF
jgi:nucleoside-diphosphate-sugar epimerase